jgi:LEA14-like dessication related protein
MNKKIPVFLVMLGLMTGAAWAFALKDDITITLEEKRIQDLSPEGATLVFYVNINNSSAKKYSLSAYRYRFMVKEQEFIRLQTPLDTGLRITPKGKTLISLPVKITYRLLHQTVSGLEDEKILACSIMGDMAFSEGRKNRGYLPFAFSGEFPIFQAPKVAVAEIKANSLTIGGADLLVKVNISNNNGFDLTLDNMRFNLKFGGHLIEQGHMGRNHRLKKGEREELALPVLLNFFDVGRDVYGILQQDVINCRFHGDLELSTNWERIKLPFDNQNKIKITKTNHNQ